MDAVHLRVPAGARLLPGAQRVHHHALRGNKESRLKSERPVELKGKAHHPLAVGNLRKHLVHKVRGSVPHCARGTRSANAAALARKGHNVVMAAARTMHPDETAFRDSTFQECAEGLLNEGRQRAVLPRNPQKPVEVVPYHRVQNGLLRLVNPALPPLNPAHDDHRGARIHGVGAAPAHGSTVTSSGGLPPTRPKTSAMIVPHCAAPRAAWA